METERKSLFCLIIVAHQIKTSIHMTLVKINKVGNKLAQINFYLYSVSKHVCLLSKPVLSMPAKDTVALAKRHCRMHR